MILAGFGLTVTGCILLLVLNVPAACLFTLGAVFAGIELRRSPNPDNRLLGLGILLGCAAGAFIIFVFA